MVSVIENYWKSSKHLVHELGVNTVSYREPLFGVDLNHALKQGLTVWWDEVRHVEHPALHLLQELT